MDEPNKKSPALTISIIVLVLAIASYGAFKYMKKEKTDDLLVNPNPVPPVMTPVETTTSYLYKDGTYSVVGEYMSPGGAEELGVEVTLKGDVITDTKATLKATRPVSVKMQNAFIGGFKSMVVGKKIDEVSLDKVSGSSLTPKGFNDAIEKIKLQAKA